MSRYAGIVCAGFKNDYPASTRQIREGRLTRVSHRLTAEARGEKSGFMICLSPLPVYSPDPTIPIRVAAGSAGEILEPYFGEARGLQPPRLPISSYSITPEQDDGGLKAGVRVGSLN